MTNQKRQAANEAPLKVLIGVGCFGIAILLMYLSLAQPRQATTMAAIRNVMRGIGGSIHPVLALVLVWLGVTIMMSAQGHPVSALNMAADSLLFVCLFTAVQLFSAQIILEQRMAITSYANFISQSYIFGAGGGVLGALLAYPLYIYLGGKWGGLIVVLMVALLCLLATGRLQRAYSWIATRLDEGQRAREQRQNARELDHLFDGDDERRGANRAQAAGRAPRRRPPEKDYIVIEDPPRVSRAPGTHRNRGLTNIDVSEEPRPQAKRPRADGSFEPIGTSRRGGNGYDSAPERRDAPGIQSSRNRAAAYPERSDAAGAAKRGGNFYDASSDAPGIQSSRNRAAAYPERSDAAGAAKRGGNGYDATSDVPGIPASRNRAAVAQERSDAASAAKRGGIGYDATSDAPGIPASRNRAAVSQERSDAAGSFEPIGSSKRGRSGAAEPAGAAPTVGSEIPSIEELSEIASDVEMNLTKDVGLTEGVPTLEMPVAPERKAEPAPDVPDFFTVHDDLDEEAPSVPEKPKKRAAVVEGTRALEVDDLVPETLPEALRGGEAPSEDQPPRAPKAERREVKADEKPSFQANDPEGEDEEEYFYPPIDLLTPGEQPRSQQVHRDADREKAEKLIDTLRSFGIETRLIGIAHGPAVTRFELQPAPGVKVSRITALSDDIALGLAALSVRIEAPIPGKSAVGVEIPNDKVEMVRLRDVLECPEAQRHPSKIAVGLGKDNSGRYIIADIAKMPHVLIAGQTGSGKSVCINSIITSILYRAAPDEVRLILIDPKVVELSIYNDIPHLIAPVVTDPKKASSALDWAVAEMGTRYKRFAERDVRDIKGYNKKLEPGEKPMPQIVIIIDELADLMMVAPGEVEDSICRLAQLARAAGMHLVIATQRPSVNVITGIIKANIPTRIAFSVASQIDSRTMIDHGGAEKLLGNGDMLFVPSGINKPLRVQGAWVSDDEVHAIVSYIKARSETTYDEDVVEKIENSVRSDAEREEVADEYDPRLPEAVEIVVEAGQASTSMLQRRMRVGYARAGRLIDEMERRGVIGEADGSKPRNVLITREQFRDLFGTELPPAAGSEA